MRTLAVMNQKGGTGKTTTSVTLAASLASRGQRTLLIDLDPQGHAGLALAIPERRVRTTIADILIDAPRTEEDEPPQSPLWSMRPNLTLIPSGAQLAAVESSAGALSHSGAREHALSRWLATMHAHFDMCVIDCAPSIGLLTFNALVASSAVIVPIETSYFAMRGAERQMSMIDSIARRTSREIPAWVVPTMHSVGDVPAERILTQIRHRYRACVSPVPIRRDPAVGEAQTLGVPVTEHKPTSQASLDYHVLADWVLGRVHALPAQRAPGDIQIGTSSTGALSRAQELAGRARAMSLQPTEGTGRWSGVTSEPKPLDERAAWLTRNKLTVHETGGAGIHRPGGTDGGP